jgi:large subunit ribosomal protein L17
MRHRNRSVRLGVKAPHRIAMLRNLTLGLIEHGRIRTTVARAKSLRPFVEKIVTRLKDPTVANIRQARKELPLRDAVMKIAKDIAPKFTGRPGGYLRILKLTSKRPGDNADMALIEWVDETLVKAYQEAPVAKTEATKKKSKVSSAAKVKKKSASKKPEKSE